MPLLDPDVPRWLLLPPADGSDFCEPDCEEPVPLELWDQACGAMTNTAPLSTRLDNTAECVFFISLLPFVYEISTIILR